MVGKKPEERYVTAYECLEDMRRIKNGEKPNLVDTSRLKSNQ